MHQQALINEKPQNAQKVKIHKNGVFGFIEGRTRSLKSATL